MTYLLSPGFHLLEVTPYPSTPNPSSPPLPVGKIRSQQSCKTAASWVTNTYPAQSLGKDEFLSPDHLTRLCVVIAVPCRGLSSVEKQVWSLLGSALSQGLVSCLQTHTTPRTGGPFLKLCVMCSAGRLGALSGFKPSPMPSMAVYQMELKVLHAISSSTI